MGASIDEIVSAAVDSIESNWGIITRLIAARKRFEKWLQVEIFRKLIDENGDWNVKLEYPYPGMRERCDFWITTGDSREMWTEIKFCVTNYCGHFCTSESTRSITDQIQGILQDADKLRRVDRSSSCNILIIAYPLPHDYQSHKYWKDRLNDLNMGGIDIVEVFSLSIHREGKPAQIVGYVGSLECKEMW